MRPDGEKNDRMAFQARANYQNHAIGRMQRGYSPLALELWYDFQELRWHLGNVDSQVMAYASICGLGQAAPNPIRSVLKYFPEDLR